MNKIALINCYMGTFPNYFQLFLDSAARNPDVDFFIFNDQPEKINTSHNVKIISLSLDEFNELASAKLDLPIEITHRYGYKLCDLRPAFGVIFEDYLRGYEFWGYCDIDIILGKITNFITPAVLSNYDVITAEVTHLAGHFTLFRNSGLTVDLFRKTEDYKIVFTDINRSYCFDESCERWGKHYSIEELINSGQTVSITDIVMELSEKLQLRLYSKYLCRECPDPFNFIYHNGVFEDINSYLGHDNNSNNFYRNSIFKVNTKEQFTKEQFMYFHHFQVKNDWRFYIPQLDLLPSEFHVTSEGIIPGPSNNLTSVNKWKIQKLLFSVKFLARSLKEMGLFSFLKRIVSKLNRKVTKGESLRFREICRTSPWRSYKSLVRLDPSLDLTKVKLSLPAHRILEDIQTYGWFRCETGVGDFDIKGKFSEAELAPYGGVDAVEVEVLAVLKTQKLFIFPPLVTKYSSGQRY